MKTYGISYKGSKSKLAERIIDILPPATHLYDLFCGGCAIAHCAMTKKKYKHIHINDIDPMMPEAFAMAIDGDFEKEDRWISREDFFKLKDTDPYVAICFSFGNDKKTYAYSRELEPYKKALHYAIYFCDFTLTDELYGIDLRPIAALEARRDRYAAAKRIIREAYQRNTPPPNARKPSAARKSHTDCSHASGTAGCEASKKKKNVWKWNPQSGMTD